MPKRTFLSFRGEDNFKVWSLRGLAEFNNVAFEMDDASLRNAIDSRDDTYIRSVIRPKIRSSDICVCLVGENTFRSRKWVPWEVGLALEERIPVIAMRFKNCESAQTPSILTSNRITPHVWDLTWLCHQLA